MTRTSMLRSAVSIAFAAVAMPAMAQRGAVSQAAGIVPTAYSFSAGAGLSNPTGDVGESLNMGITLQGSVNVRTAALPFGLRFDGMYHRFGFNEDVGVKGNANILGGTANAVFTMVPASSPLRPYFMGGLGLYRASYSVRGGDDDSETRLGLQGGAGVDFGIGTRRAFVEARYHNILTSDESTSMFPIVFGLRF